MVMNPVDTIDRIVQQRFLVMMQSPEEMLQMFSPQILCISDPNLNGEEFPALEVLERRSVRADMMYLMYNSVTIYLYVGR